MPRPHDLNQRQWIFATVNLRKPRQLKGFHASLDVDIEYGVLDNPLLNEMDALTIINRWNALARGERWVYWLVGRE